MRIHIIFFSLTLASLVQSYSTAEEPVLSEFNKTISINCTVTKIKSSDIGELVDMTVIDSVLVINEMFNDKIFKLFNISTGEMICNCIRRGKGPNEMLYPHIIIRLKHDVFATYSSNKRELVYMSINDLKNGRFEFKSIDKLDLLGSFKAYPINDSMIISTGMFEEGRYCLYNKYSKRKLIKFEYPDDPNHKNESNRIKGFAYQGTISIKLDQTKFAIATSSSGNLEIYELLKNDFRQVFQKTYFFPKYIARQGGAAFLKESKNGFLSIESTNRYIYVIYSGRSKKESKIMGYGGNHLLVYNWHGEPVINFKLDRDIMSMSLQDSNNGVKIIAHSINQTSYESEIITYTLPDH